MKYFITLIILIAFSHIMGKGNKPISKQYDIESSVILQTQEKKRLVVQLTSEFTEDGDLKRNLLIKENKNYCFKNPPSKLQ